MLSEEAASDAGAVPEPAPVPEGMAAEPGVSFLLCDVTTNDGTPHDHLGMVSEITIE